jgi:hypothetical protein
MEVDPVQEPLIDAFVDSDDSVGRFIDLVAQPSRVAKMPRAAASATRSICSAACFLLIAALATPTASISAQTAREPSAAQRMQEPGTEERELSGRAGIWDVVITLRLTPDATPVVTRDVEAERRLVGLYLQEIMKPVSGSSSADSRRIAYLYYSGAVLDPVRWDRLSVARSALRIHAQTQVNPRAARRIGKDAIACPVNRSDWRAWQDSNLLPPT